MACTTKHEEEEESKSASKLWALGVALSILGSLSTNMGVNLQKYSFMKEAKKSINIKRSYFRQPAWVIGFIMVVAGGLFDFVALGFLPQSLATPIGGSTIVANVVFASLFLKEKFTRVDAFGTTLVLAGILLAALFSNAESSCYTAQEIYRIYIKLQAILYKITMVFVCAATLLMARRMEKILKVRGHSSPEYKRFAKAHSIAYPALSGVFGAQSVLFSKSVAELIKTTATGENQMNQPGVYVLGVFMIACVFLQIHFLAHGLQSFDAVFIVPVFQCFFISISVLGGGVYFDEFDAMSTLQLCMFFLGVSITLFGVYVLSRRDMKALKPIGKMRAGVKMVMFISRAQRHARLRSVNRITEPKDKRKVHPFNGDSERDQVTPLTATPLSEVTKDKELLRDDASDSSSSVQRVHKLSPLKVINTSKIVPIDHDQTMKLASFSSNSHSTTPKLNSAAEVEAVDELIGVVAPDSHPEESSSSKVRRIRPNEFDDDGNDGDAPQDQVAYHTKPKSRSRPKSKTSGGSVHSSSDTNN